MTDTKLFAFLLASAPLESFLDDPHEWDEEPEEEDDEVDEDEDDEPEA